jgi:hypothetical protein
MVHFDRSGGAQSTDCVRMSLRCAPGKDSKMAAKSLCRIRVALPSNAGLPLLYFLHSYCI